MKGKKGTQYLEYFLKNSPRALYKRQKIIFSPLLSKKESPPIISDREYVQEFLNRIEILRFNTRYQPAPQVHNNFLNIFKNSIMQREDTHWAPTKQSQKLLGLINRLTSSGKETLILYQEMEQRLVIASPQVINEVKKRLIYLFKVLLNRRDHLQTSLQLEANVQLSQTIIKSFQRAHQVCQLSSDLKKLEAMERLTQAKANQRNGLKQVAMNDFQQIFKDSAASAKTRFEALRVLCMDSEQIGDAKILEELLREMKQRGEKQYQQYLAESISRIKVGDINQQSKKSQ